MRSLALHGIARQWLARLHRWSGLVIMACMLVAAATGTWLTFRVELDRWLNPHLRVVQPAEARVTLASIVLLAFTSFYQNLPQFVRPVVNAFSPLAPRPAGRSLTPGDAMISPDRALASLSERYRQARPSSIGRDLRNGRYSILFQLPGDLAPHGDNWAFVDLSTGRLLALRLAATSSAGDQFLTWIFPLHTGTAFGLPGRVVVALAGVGLMILVVTGFYVWWIKWRMRRRARARPRVSVLSEGAIGRTEAAGNRV